MKSIWFSYTNFRGETSVRHASPLDIRFTSTKWHPTAQWILRAYDHGKQAERDFALSDCNFTQAPKP